MVGKEVGNRRYLHIEQVPALERELSNLVSQASQLLWQYTGASYNVLRINEDLGEVAFLDYPTLAQVPFPRLANSWRVHPASSLISHRTYIQSLNPPILHRTELLLGEAHPQRGKLERLTSACESIGLFANTSTIGFERQWNELIASRGYQVVDFDLVPLGNDLAPLPVEQDSAEISIARHLTALSRASLSAPIQCLLRHALLTKNTALFDYGCGRGDDMRTLAENGFQVAGWDPHYRPNGVRVNAYVVNLGFVINVIEDKDERVDALLSAYRLTDGVLAVSAMTVSNELTPGTIYKDGVLTSRRTFQKYYTQAGLKHFLESTLGEDAYSAAPGVFYVFKDRMLEQRYLLGRTSNRTRCVRVQRTAVSEPIRRPATSAHSQRSLGAEQRSMLESLWVRCLELGRIPEPSEVQNLEELSKHFGTFRRAIGMCAREHDAYVLERAAEGRRADIAVMLALQYFGSRQRFTELDPTFRRDIRALFGSFAVAEDRAHELLFSVSNQELIAEKCRVASALGLGWLDSNHSLQLHSSLVERLDPVLRVYVGCAAALAGDVKQFDLVKIHIASGKLSLMKYDDFLSKALPLLRTRVKARLRDQELDVFEYGSTQYPATVLYWKSRYINEEFANYADQLEFDEALSRLGLFDMAGHGDSEERVVQVLEENRWEISDFHLKRSSTKPSLDAKCGRTFTYRQLLECGESWKRLRISNTPESPDSYNALFDLGSKILDPIVEYFGAIQLTYGFSSPALSRQIRHRIDPKLDQHAACELNAKGSPVCTRKGAAVDFVVADENMREVAEWIIRHLPFDRLYYYGPDRPLHVSYGPDHSRESFEMIERGGKRIPRRGL